MIIAFIRGKYLSSDVMVMKRRNQIPFMNNRTNNFNFHCIYIALTFNAKKNNQKRSSRQFDSADASDL